MEQNYDFERGDWKILCILFSGIAFLVIFMFTLHHYNPDSILLLCEFALMLWWIYLVISYQREIEENMKKENKKKN